MKKVLLLSLGLVMGLCAFAQETAVKSLSAPVKATLEKKALGTEVVEGKVNVVTRGTQSVVAVFEEEEYSEAETMYTTYDLQSNGFLANRMYQLKDGSVAVTANFSAEEYDASFLDRGTGYSFAAGGDVDLFEMPEARVEDIRTGWPTIAPYGAEGEILVNHAEGLNYWIREKAGEGEWDGPHAIPNPDPAKLEGIEAGLSLAWPRVVTSGENNEVVHIFAAAQGSEGYHQFYVRSTDLQNWDVQFAPLAIDGYHTGFYAADDCAASSNGKDIAVVYCTGFMSHVMLYESNDEGLTWKSRMVWESPIHGLDWTTDENSLIEKLYGPTHASVAIGNDGVSHVVLGVGLYDRPELSNSYMIYAGLMTDGIAYWNDTTAWEYRVEGLDTIPVLSPIRSPRDYDLRHALRLWWEDETGEYIQMDLTNFCAWMPPHAEEGYNAFDLTYQYTGSDAGTAGDYMALFGLSAYPSIAVDPVGNLAVAWSSPDLNRDLYSSIYYMRSIFVKYKPANAAYWWMVDNHGMSLYDGFVHTGDEATYISAVSNSVNPNEFWFSCLSDDTPGFYTGSVVSQPILTTGTVNVFKYTPSNGYETDSWLNIGETMDVVYNIFPNPASEYVCISSSMEANATVTFSNIAGQTVKVVNTNLTTGDNTVVVSDLASGVYFCTVTANGYSHTSKVVVK